MGDHGSWHTPPATGYADDDGVACGRAGGVVARDHVAGEKDVVGGARAELDEVIDRVRIARQHLLLPERERVPREQMVPVVSAASIARRSSPSMSLIVMSPFPAADSAPLAAIIEDGSGQFSVTVNGAAEQAAAAAVEQARAKVAAILQANPKEISVVSASSCSVAPALCFAGMDLDAIRALRRQRHRDGDQLLVLEGDGPAFDHRLVEGQRTP